MFIKVNRAFDNTVGYIDLNQIKAVYYDDYLKKISLQVGECKILINFIYGDPKRNIICLYSLDEIFEELKTKIVKE